MIPGKPFTKGFDALLDELTAHWGGKVRRPKTSPPPTGGYGVSADLFHYPSYRTEKKGFPLSVEISRFPLSGLQASGVLADCDFLRISLRMKPGCHVVIRHEDLFDVLKKKVRLAREYQTGNEAFDQKYYLHVRSAQGENLVSDRPIQDMVRQLEPFAVIGLTANGLEWAQELRAGSQLAYPDIEGRVSKLLELAEAVRKKTPG